MRRSDLFDNARAVSPAGSESSIDVRNELDPETEAQLKSRLAAIYGDVEIDNEATNEVDEEPLGQNDKGEGNEEDEAFDFRLFSTSKNEEKKKEGASVQRIILNDEQVLGDGAFVRQRDPSFYIREKATGERKQEIESVAVSGEDVLRGKERRNWGCEVPWRVTVIRASRLENGAIVQHPDAESGADGKKKKPGKKRRIMLRIRMKKKVEATEKKKAEAEAKEAALREKKTRRNREKKVKRKMKEKAEKEAKRANSGADGDPGNTDDVEEPRNDAEGDIDRDTSPE